MAIDPVCGMEVDEGQSSLKSTVDGRDVYFCCSNCKEEFDSNPGRFMFDFS
ncbi:MAG: YHS domain-containing protein [Thaumarchaeota archaeon]|nr:YHS domain-containing protein [Nitrososphaerota archaeon]MDE1872704.1 YHS domain-containing protein [Nitrososphaerota archaeon]